MQQPRSGGELRRDWAPCHSRGAGAPSGEIGKHEARRLVVGTTLPQVAKAMTGNRPATSEPRRVGSHRRFVGSHPALARLRTVYGRSGSNARNRSRRGAARRHGGTPETTGSPRFRLRHAGRGLTRRSRRGPTALHLARAAPVVHDAPRGQGTMPLVPPHLER